MTLRIAIGRLCCLDAITYILTIVTSWVVTVVVVVGWLSVSAFASWVKIETGGRIIGALTSPMTCLAGLGPSPPSLLSWESSYNNKTRKQKQTSEQVLLVLFDALSGSCAHTQQTRFFVTLLVRFHWCRWHRCPSYQCHIFQVGCLPRPRTLSQSRPNTKTRNQKQTSERG